jgi:hypothetical protein
MDFSAAFDPFRALRASWSAVRQAPLPLLLGGILLVFTSGNGGGGAGFNPGGMQGSFDRDFEDLLPVFVGIAALACCVGTVFFLFSSWLEVGFQNTVQRVLETGEGDAGMLFDARGRFWDMVLVRLFAALLTFAAALPLLLVAAAIAFAADRGLAPEGALIVFGILLGLILITVVIFVALGLSLSTQAVALEGLRPGEALRRSWNLVAGHRLQLFLYWLVLGVFSFLGVCACCVGVLLTGSLARIAPVDSYLALTRGGERPSWWIETARVTPAAPAGSWGTTSAPPPPAPPPPYEPPAPPPPPAPPFTPPTA